MKFECNKYFDSAGTFGRIMLIWVSPFAICMFFMKLTCNMLDRAETFAIAEKYLTVQKYFRPYLSDLGLSLLDLHVQEHFRP